MITIHRKDDAHLFLEADDSGDLLVIDAAFRFRPQGFQFMPSYKRGQWDGWLHLFEIRTRLMPVGLYSRLLKVCEREDVQYELGDDVADIFDSQDDFNVEDYPITMDGSSVEPYSYQCSAVTHFVKTNRGVCLSPTGSGKSVIIYLLIRHWLDSHDKKILLIVPNLSLVNQMKSDILDYAAGDTSFSEGDIHIIKGGTAKRGEGRLFVATWQSLGKVDEEDYYEQFSSVLVDECFTGDTPVLTESGYKDISTIESGDIVINYDENARTFKSDVVERVHKNINSDRLMLVTMDNGDTLRVTENHKFLTHEGWVKAKHLNHSHNIVSYH